MADFTLFEVHLHDGFSFSPTNTAPMFSGEKADADTGDQQEAVGPKGKVSKLLGKRATSDGGTSASEKDSSSESDDGGVDQIETSADVENRERKSREENVERIEDEYDDETDAETEEESGGNGGKLLLALVLVVVIAAVAKSLMGGDAGFDELEELDELSDEA